MKKLIISLAIVGLMTSFAACTQKAAQEANEESIDTTAVEDTIEVEVDSLECVD